MRMSEADWDAVLDINLKGTFLFTKALARSFIKQRSGRIINIASGIGHLKHPYRLVRCFLKGFVGDQVNLLLAAAAWNLRKWMREGVLFWLQLVRLIFRTRRFTLLLAQA